ncbi:Tol-Pal system beta propeller repeat protein TolB [Hahella aquimaris]|uniref:Tol-Pal system beta propeller repeat protein TolB n=1 Tax=Hahella sp. HNIBRBA332 TaxID=3015983 RepID=UPI00273CAF2D|nr:Tol-Pal system beta propeller repeat protein TolB [Hahella sp. HNIBRBA332]WLQ14935.1 Tol-Pal system beta propeller repeat protein TolB [Hahella sp. HNIBRBA332]
MKKHIFFTLVLLISGLARADLVIEIDKGSREAIPVAVVPFANESGQPLAEDIAQIVTEDLKRSGDINPLDRTRMLSIPSKVEEIYFSDWARQGQRYLLVGGVQYDAPSQVYKVRYELYNVQSQQRVIGKILSGKSEKLRDLGHAVADAVYEAVTGIRGVFSTRIAYVTLEKSGSKNIYKLEVSDADGRRSQEILKKPMPIISPAWSPDGKKLAYVSFESQRPAIYVQDIATGTRTQVTSYKGLNSAPTWSPDGTKLAVTLSKDGNAELYVLDLRNNSLKRLTNHWAIDTEASWSPDGRTIAFTSDRGGGPQIYLMDASGGTPRRLTFEGRYNSRPRFSVDGKKVYYVHQRDGSFNVASLDLESGQDQILTQTEMDESPSVAPNGSMIIYATQKNGKGVLAVVGVNSGSKYTLPAQFGDVREPAWSPYISR